jgi:hypothetical protein
VTHVRFIAKYAEDANEEGEPRINANQGIAVIARNRRNLENEHFTAKETNKEEDVK